MQFGNALGKRVAPDVGLGEAVDGQAVALVAAHVVGHDARGHRHVRQVQVDVLDDDDFVTRLFMASIASLNSGRSVPTFSHGIPAR